MGEDKLTELRDLKEIAIGKIKAAYNPVKGENPGIKANAIASGTSANATVSPDKISIL